MPKQSDLDVIPQTIDYLDDARNCACCRLLYTYVKWGTDGEDTPWFAQECKLKTGPLWDSDDIEDNHPASPGRTVCNLWVSDQLL